MNPLYTIPHLPADGRLTADRHTNTVFPITHFSSRAEVERRQEELRFTLRMSAGLYPWPEKTPLNPRTEHVGDFDGYSIYKIMFETYPGLWSTGNLYLPRPLGEKHPAILNVLGHFTHQRLHRDHRADFPQQLANFARMGFVCLIVDMIGRIDNRQLSHEYGRGEKDLWTSCGLGVQLWNNIRALDLLCAMPQVDADRIGVTGASGGGSQTLTLSLVDDRVKAAAPINMISLHMQGGCQCENSPGLRRHTDNAELCAMLAPRPLFLAGSTGDWTCNLETAEYPAALEAYRHFGAEDMVEIFYQDDEHQYNGRTRHHVYSFFARHLMGHDPHRVEEVIETPDLKTFTWFPAEGKAPGFADDEEFFAYHKAERLARVAPCSREEKLAMLRWVTGVYDTRPAVSNATVTETEDGTLETGILTGDRGEAIPFARLTPADWDGERICLFLGDGGREALDSPAARHLLRDGVALVSGDLFRTGERAHTPRIRLGSDYDNRFFTTFHYPDEALRVQDVALLWTLTAAGVTRSIHAEGPVASLSVALALPLLKDVGDASMTTLPPLDTDGDYMTHCPIIGLPLLGGAEGCLRLASCPRRVRPEA